MTLKVGNLTGTSAVRIHSTVGFEYLRYLAATDTSYWYSVGIASHTDATVTVSNVPANATKIRYNWYSNPCGEDCFRCGVYVTTTRIGILSGELDFLPLPPFMANL